MNWIKHKGTAPLLINVKANALRVTRTEAYPYLAVNTNSQVQLLGKPANRWLFLRYHLISNVVVQPPRLSQPSQDTKAWAMNLSGEDISSWCNKQKINEKLVTQSTKIVNRGGKGLERAIVEQNRTQTVRVHSNCDVKGIHRQTVGKHRRPFGGTSLLHISSHPYSRGLLAGPLRFPAPRLVGKPL